MKISSIIMVSLPYPYGVESRHMSDSNAKKHGKKIRLTPEAKDILRELGRVGGKTRAQNLSPEERRISAVKASRAASEARARKAAVRKKR